MNIALLDARQGDRKPENSSTVAYRNMLVLSRELGADLFVSAKQLRRSTKTYEAIICGFGSTSCERDESVKFLQRNANARLFWLVGEYEQSTFAPLFYCKREYDVIKNYEHEMKNKQARNQHFVNLNTLLAEPAPQQVNRKKIGAIYYGRWRGGRAKYFRRYLHGNVMLSTSAKNMKIFIGNGCNPKFAKPLSWTKGRETLRIAAASLYIEDEFTHTHYNCPANRFYESIALGCPLAFQPECKATFDKYGLEIPSWMIVKNQEDLENYAKKIMSGEMLNQALDIQKQWGERAAMEKAQTIAQIKSIIS